ncbi:MAG: D-alanyl-D-alanine carboxypeptidase/D-alanyl-D-alanine-endopeptidase [Bacteroidales bacterium]|nr:D-alanyl-D-alanine carboxypeptidase/D-alanyl-D-alanine-endopeptidase [Bacteroidales bacterium]
MRNNYINLVIIICIFQIIQGVQAQNKTELEVKVLAADKTMQNAVLGIYVKNLTTGTVLSAFNEEKSLVPASVNKILCTGAALSLLGKDYKFETVLKYYGTISKEGLLQGSVEIKGGGDPTLCNTRLGKEYSQDSIFDNWYKALVKAGIKTIEGEISFDESIYEDNMLPGGYQWEDMGNYYGCGASGLNYNENYFTITFKSGQKLYDSTKIIKINPEIPGLIIKNKVLTGKTGSGDNCIIYGSPNSDLRFAEGTIPADLSQFEVKGSIPSPARALIYNFEKYLTAKGIIIKNKALYRLNNLSAAQASRLYTHYSASLKEIIKLTNTKSINIYAESLLKLCGYKQKGKGSTAAGIEAVQDYWQSRAVKLVGLQMNDGSGLSPTNRLTAKISVDVLSDIYKNKDIYESFNQSLAVGGESGSVKNIFKDSPYANNIKVKSGYMKGVRAYAGYITNRKNQTFAFTIIVNNYNCTPSEMKNKLEKIMLSIAESE